MVMSSTDHQYSQAAKAMNSENNNQRSSASRKTGSNYLRPPAAEQALKCPRCDSPNTKFCYYNNYSLTQPRHFCKSCRRYWTKGGTLRNVPIGGGCRKNSKKIRSSSSSGSRLSSASPASSENGTGLNFFPAPSAMEFQVLASAAAGGAGGGIPFARNGIFSNFITYGDISSSTCVTTPASMINPTTNPSCFDIEGSSPTTMNTGSLMGFNFVGSSSAVHQDMGLSPVNNIQGNNNNTSTLASSIESLSCLNQDLHWKLQQQRLGMLFGNGEMLNQNQCNKQERDDFGSSGGGDSSLSLHGGVHHDQQIEKPQPILFQNLEIPKEDHESACDPRKNSNGNINNTTTGWRFFDHNSTSFPTTTTTNSNNMNSSDQGMLQGNEDTSTWNGIQGWNQHHHQQQQLHHQHQYSA